MKPTISSAASTRLALVAFACLWLGACGGGGGGSTAPAPGDAGGAGSVTGAPSALGPAPDASPAPAGTPVAGGGTPATGPASSPPSASSGAPSPVPSPAFTAFSSTVVGGLPQFPGPSVVARLAGGGGVTVWSDGTSLFAQRFDAAGAPVGNPVTVAAAVTRFSSYDVAQLADGGWVVAWADSLPSEPGNGRAALATLQFKRFSASGAQVQDTTDVTGRWWGLYGFHVRGTADGGFAVALAGNQSIVAPDVLLQRFDANGAKVGPLAAPAISALPQGNGNLSPTVVPLPDNSVEVLWLRRSLGSRRTVVMQHFDAQSGPIGAAVAINETQQVGDSDFAFDAAMLTDGRIAVTWGEIPGATTTPVRQFWLIADQAGAVQSAVGSMVVGSLNKGLAVAPAVGGSFTLFSQPDQSAPGLFAWESVDVLSVDSHGAAQGTWATLVNRLTVGPNTSAVATGYSVASGPDGHYVVSYEEAVPGSGKLNVLGK